LKWEILLFYLKTLFRGQPAAEGHDDGGDDEDDADEFAKEHNGEQRHTLEERADPIV